MRGTNAAKRQPLTIEETTWLKKAKEFANKATKLDQLCKREAKLEEEAEQLQHRQALFNSVESAAAHQEKIQLFSEREAMLDEDIIGVEEELERYEQLIRE